MKLKSMVAIATTAIVSVSLTSCGDAGGEGEGGGEIAIITVDPANPYWAAEVNRAEELAEELGYEYSVGAHENDPDEQTRLMETAINNDVDGILLDPAGADESVAIVEQAVDAGLPRQRRDLGNRSGRSPIHLGQRAGCGRGCRDMGRGHGLRRYLRRTDR